MNTATTNDKGRKIKRARGLDGEPIGRTHANLLFDTRDYEIGLTHGTRDSSSTE
jgi:hypothetical protein